MFCNLVDAEEIQELANRSVFYATIIIEGVLEEDSLIHHTLFRHENGRSSIV